MSPAGDTAATGVGTEMEWDTLDWDTHGFTDLASDARLITIPAGADGVYMVTTACAVEANSTGRRLWGIELEATSNRVADFTTGDPSTGVWRTSVSALVTLAAGDALRVNFFQDSGTTLDAGVAGSYEDATWFGLHQVMPATVIVPPRTSSGNSHQIVTSGTRPSVKWDGLMIYETDTQNTLTWNASESEWLQPWNQPWGVLDYAEITSNPATFNTTAVDVSGLSVTFTAILGRRYRVMSFGLMSVDTTDRSPRMDIYTSADVLEARGQAHVTAASAGTTVSAQAYFSGISGSKTYKVKCQLHGGSGATTLAGATTPAVILVEDLGLA